MRTRKPTNKTRLTATTRCLLGLMALAFLAPSCSSDDSVATPVNDYCYIKSVTLGTIKRKTSTLNTSFTGSTFEMTIDQRTGAIENRDSLPYGSQLSRVIATITFEGSTLAYSEVGKNSWTAYNSTDSLDLTKPLQFRLTSNDKESERIYTLKVNVHKQEGDSLQWTKCEDEELLADMEDMKAFVQNGKLAVLGKKASGTVLLERSGIEASGTWQEAPTDLPAEADIQTLRQQDSKLYLSTTDGKILSSTDAKEWTETGSYLAPLTLIEKTEAYFYAIAEGKLLRSADGTNWEEEQLDAETTMLPETNIRALTTEQANGNQRIIMIGHKGDRSEAVVWNKMWNESEPEETATWTYFPVSPDNDIPCPQLDHCNLLSYDGNCIIFGGDSTDDEWDALQTMFVSKDYGITWRPSTEIRMPAKMKDIEGCITGTVDSNNFIWIITNAQVWRGRLNRLGFAQQ
ncbi:MAG: hypothetical protein IJ219_06900 [Bacteroidaceae bacterium]|nr:hypothetical protein [Bacteroidaceae bacterium]